MKTISPFIDNSIDNVMLQTKPDFTSRFWIHKHSWTSPGRHVATQQSSLVIDWLLGPQAWIDGIYQRFFSFISTHILLGLISPGSAEADIGWGEKLNGRCWVKNIHTKNYKNLIIFVQVRLLESKMSRMFFLRHSLQS